MMADTRKAKLRATVRDASATPTGASIARALGINGKAMRARIRNSLGVYISREDSRTYPAAVRDALVGWYVDGKPSNDVIDTFKRATSRKQG